MPTRRPPSTTASPGSDARERVACHARAGPRFGQSASGPMSRAATSGLKTHMNARTRHHAPTPARRRGDTHDGHGVRRPSLDAVIVGGGPAGLSAALVLGRARQRVLVVDTGRPANAASQGIGGLLAQTVAPSDLRQAGREQLAAFANVEVRD